jgi:hypothetical protein
MEKKSFLIIGYGSSGKRFVNIIKKLKIYKKIYIYTKQNCPFDRIENLNEIKNKKIDFVIICSKTSLHFEHLRFIDQNKKNLTILIEKPLYSKNINYKPKNKRIYVGYNLRFDPLIDYLKNKIKRKKILFLILNCFSFLPKWRINRRYQDSYSAFKRDGGGVTNDLSHEIDLASYLSNIKKINFAKKLRISKLKINTDDFSSLYAISKFNKPIVINLSYFFYLNMRNIFVSLKNSSFYLSFDERKIVEYSNNRKFTKFLKIKDKNYSYKMMLKSILNNNVKNCCSYENGLFINKIISKYK